LCWDLQTLLLPKLLHEREQTLHPLPLGLPLGPLSLPLGPLSLPLGPLSLPLGKQGLLSLLKTLHLSLQYLTPMFQ
jgi:hypothetical protein